MSGALGRELEDEPDLSILESDRFRGVIVQIAGACARHAPPGGPAGSVS